MKHVVCCSQQAEAEGHRRRPPRAFKGGRSARGEEGRSNQNGASLRDVVPHRCTCSLTLHPCTRRSPSSVNKRLIATWQVLAEHIFCHVPCPTFDYRGKVTYIAICLRRIMTAIIDPSTIDDRSSPAVSIAIAPQPAYAKHLTTVTCVDIWVDLD